MGDYTEYSIYFCLFHLILVLLKCLKKAAKNKIKYINFNLYRVFSMSVSFQKEKCVLFSERNQTAI